MPLQETSGAASYDAFGGGAPVAANYIEDVFQTWLYTGNGSTQTINNGIDLAGKGGMVWIKARNGAFPGNIFDTVRNNGYLETSTNRAVNGAGGGVPPSSGIFPFNSNGFTFADGLSYWNSGSYNYVSWTFREQPKFFDVVTYTGNGSDPQTISHNLGSVPGCMIVKRTDSATNGSWYVYHRSLTTPSATATNNYLLLNTTDASVQDNGYWGFGSSITATTFEVNNQSNINGATYVAYLFAHDAGGFGLTGTDNVISCGSFTGNGSTSGPEINLGYEPQWIMIKNASAVTNWRMFDNMRGMPVPTSGGASGNSLEANTSAAEAANDPAPIPTATGFRLATTNSNLNGNGNTMIYIAIRRGPMRTPTTGTSVYQASYFGSGAAGTPAYISGFPPDFAIHGGMIDGSTNKFATDRLRGTPNLFTNLTNSEGSNASNIFYQNGFYSGLGSALSNYFAWMFRRAPGFFDEVCYTGTGSATTVAHNLGVAPELMIVKRRSGTGAWCVYTSALGNTRFLELNTNYVATTSTDVWNDTTPTSSVFTVGVSSQTNGSGSTFVAYLFATCPGVSKVGTYTGTGTTQTINCGFTGGARFVLIKRNADNSDWYVWDSARGIVAGNDPYLLLNSTAAEVTNTDFIDTASTGFEISSTAPAAINANGGTFVFLAIA